MTKPNTKNTASLSTLQDLVSKSKSVAVVDYTGMKVSQITQLRRDIKKAGGQLLVTKNTLFKIAAGIKDTKLEGISAFVFSMQDEVSAVKALADFAKKNSTPTFKMGMLGTKVLSAAEIAQLAAIPDKNTLIAQTLSGFNTPLFKLVYGLNWNISKLVRTLDAVRASKS